jgi:transposase, IS5 family
VTDAAVHDSQEPDGLLDEGNTCNDVFAGRPRSRPNSGPLSLAQVRANHKSRIRARIEHVFGSHQSAPGGRIVRTIGMVRARAKIDLQNLATTFAAW